MVDVNQDDDGYGVSVTLKAGTGYEAPWIVVRGKTPTDVLAQLADENFDQLVRTVVPQYAADFVLAFQQVKQQRGGQAQQGQSQAVQNVVNATGGTVTSKVRTCVHGELVRRTGSKNGKTWVGWFCPTPKDTPGQCDPVFENN